MLTRFGRWLAEWLYVKLGFCREEFGCLNYCKKYEKKNLFYLKLKYLVIGYIAGIVIFVGLLILLQK